MWNSRKGIYGIFFLIMVGVILLFFFMGMHFIGLHYIFGLGKTIVLSIELDERGSFLYALLNSEKDGIKNMELISSLYIDPTRNTGFLENTINKMYPYWQLRIKTSDDELVIGRKDIGEDALSTKFEVPVPGAGKAGTTKYEVIFKT